MFGDIDQALRAATGSEGRFRTLEAAARVSSLLGYETPFFSASSIAVTKVSNSSSVV